MRHLSGLDALRAYAALSVVIYHLPFNRILGRGFLDGLAAVDLFFVLSGFLITYLLLQERAASGHVAVRKFYIRRALRILPLYYLALIVGVISLRFVGHQTLPPLMIAGYALMAGHIAYAVYGFLPIVGVLWSISIEEWFYSAWCWVIQWRAVVWVAVSVIILRIALTPLIESTDPVIASVWGTLRFELMALGALGAWLYINRPNVIQILTHPIAYTVAVLFMGFMALFDPPVPSYIAALFYVVLVLNVIRRPLFLNALPLRWIGERSYGIYIWHQVVLYGLSFLGVTNLWVIPLAIVGTLLVAHLSYTAIETPFLRLKNRFAARTETIEDLTPAKSN